MNTLRELRLVPVRRRFPRPVIADLEASVRDAIRSAGPRVQPGASIALAVGSRGIGDLPRIVKAAAEALRSLGAEPFIVPAMGSHGGATAEGQRELLGALGVTEAALGCPICSSMEVVQVSTCAEGPVFMDRLAWEADGVVLINRIKPHTDFHDRYESGLVKMSAIGLGKARQAEEIHRYGIRGLTEVMPRVAEAVLASGKIVVGIAVVENAYDEPMIVEGIEPERLLQREPELLDIARAHMPRLPVHELDLLIVDRMGKEISGVGMDPNIIGRIRIDGQPEPESPRIRAIVVTELTDASHGNAAGVGLADVTTKRLFEKMDLDATNRNIVTSGFLGRGKIPLIAPTDRDAVSWALRSCGPLPAGRERIIRLRDTLHLADLHVSEAVLEEIGGEGSLEWVGDPAPCFGEDHQLPPFSGPMPGQS